MSTKKELQKIFEEIKADPENAKYTEQGIDPLYEITPEAKILIVGQAPGKRAQDTRIFWNDPSGDNLRQWMGVDRDTFYNSKKFAILPMDFYYPGKGRSGDLPPRKDFAAKWHKRLLQYAPKIELTLLVGSYATKHYLGLKSQTKLTDIVRDYKAYLPEYFPLVHPSPRNKIWQSKNPWFQAEVLPDLKERVHKILED